MTKGISTFILLKFTLVRSLSKLPLQIILHLMGNPFTPYKKTCALVFGSNDSRKAGDIYKTSRLTVSYVQ
ncbi:hypothetical protein Hanom_Chr11g00967941 [Helianthus anomalus]